MKNKFTWSGIFGVLFILLIVLVKVFDVAPIGPAGTRIGFSGINHAVAELVKTNTTWYNITEVFGIVAILVALCFALFGLVQLIKRRSLVKVDGEILSLAGLYAAVVVLYALFEVVIINYRPVIMPDEVEPEASFPSSHTMLICVIMGSTILLLNDYLKKYIKNDAFRNILKVICVVIIVLTVLGRLISGVHWFTDILGGVLISATLLFLYSGILDKLKNN